MQEILIAEKSSKKNNEWGTFKDSLKAPVHRWFTYPAGFSYKAVEHSILDANLKKGTDTIFDPFMGSGTTNIASKCLGFNSVGIEAHPFVFSITKSKMNWNIKEKNVLESIEEINKSISKTKRPKNLKSFLKKQFPELILKCFLQQTLFELLIIRNSIAKLKQAQGVKDFLNVALICVLRDVSTAATGWPYIAPKKVKITSMSKKGADTYFNRVLRMHKDLQIIKKSCSNEKTKHKIILGDSRNSKQIKTSSIDHIFTSPPYLNNFDYADRTRLEMYFMGFAKNWGDISKKIRTQLITSATTQISRTDTKYKFHKDFINDCPQAYEFLSNAVVELGAMRLKKGGKKSYDLMTVGYFNDLYATLKENFRVLKPNTIARYILGDSAPYGIHIPTDILIGQIGKCVGFKEFEIEILRLRGGKWAHNPQRHSVSLRESIVTLYK